MVGSSVASEPAASLASQETAAEEPTAVDISLLQQQRQLAERFKQVEAMLHAQRRAHALEKVRMDLRIATAEADTIKEGGAVPKLRPSKAFLQSCVIIQTMWRGKAAARLYSIKRRTATKIQAAARRLLAMRQLVAARGAATKIATSVRRHAAIVERARLLRERSATRVQAAFRLYKSRVLDAPAVTKSRLIARRLHEESLNRDALRSAEADKAAAVAAAVAAAEADKATAVAAAVAAAEADKAAAAAETREAAAVAEADKVAAMAAAVAAAEADKAAAVAAAEKTKGGNAGRGVLRLANGNVYEGECKAGKREGRGVFRYASGDVYEGEWKAGKREGRGVMRYADGTVQSNFYEQDAHVGEGVMWRADGLLAVRLRDGKIVPGWISLEEARRTAERLGLPIPTLPGA